MLPKSAENNEVAEDCPWLSFPQELPYQDEAYNQNPEEFFPHPLSTLLSTKLHREVPSMLSYQISICFPKLLQCKTVMQTQAFDL